MGVQKWGKEDTTPRKIVFNWGNRKRVDRVVKHSNHHLEDYSKIALLYILLFIITQFLLPPYKKGTCLSTFLIYFTFSDECLTTIFKRSRLHYKWKVLHLFDSIIQLRWHACSECQILSVAWISCKLSRY